MTSKSKLIYENKFSYTDYRNVGKYYDFSFTTKCDKWLPLPHQLNEFRNFNPRTEYANEETDKENVFYKSLKI